MGARGGGQGALVVMEVVETGCLLRALPGSCCCRSCGHRCTAPPAPALHTSGVLLVLRIHACAPLLLPQVHAAASEAEGLSFLLICGKPLGEPIVQHGPFVMNTQEEIHQAFRDYQTGKLQLAEDNPWQDDNDEL